jgi:hypothetical protein
MYKDTYAQFEEATDRGDILWHYTTWEGFTSIVTKDELWASDCRFMNDTKEIWHAVEFCRGKYPAEMQHVNGFIEDLITRNVMLPHANVLSVSREFDSLEQWRGYAYTSVGVALGFDSKSLTRILELQGFARAKCLYVGKLKERRIRSQSKRSIANRARLQKEMDAADNVRDKHNVDKRMGGTNSGDLGDFLTENAVAFKDEKFKNEKEVRFSSEFQDITGNVNTRHRSAIVRPEPAFRRRGSAILPYVRLSLSLDSKLLAAACVTGPYPSHPLVALMIGPSAEPQTLPSSAWIKTLAQKEPPVKYSNFDVAVSRVTLRA